MVAPNNQDKVRAAIMTVKSWTSSMRIAKATDIPVKKVNKLMKAMQDDFDWNDTGAKFKFKSDVRSEERKRLGKMGLLEPPSTTEKRKKTASRTKKQMLSEDDEEDMGKCEKKNVEDNGEMDNDEDAGEEKSADLADGKDDDIHVPEADKQDEASIENASK